MTYMKAYEAVTMPVGGKHTLIAETEFKVIEVRVGADISVKDKIKYSEEQTENAVK